MKNRILLLLAACWLCVGLAQAFHYPDALYEEWRKTPYPDKGIVVRTNPTALLWPSALYWEKRQVTYNIYLSQDKNFPEGKTIRSLNQRACFFNPHRRLEQGVWYWKYEEVERGKVIPKGTFSFKVTAASEVFESPSLAEFVNNVPVGHPRILNYGRDLRSIRKSAPTHPLYQRIIQKAQQAAEKEIYRGSVESDDPVRHRQLQGITGREFKNYYALLEGYVLSGDKEFLRCLLERTNVLLTWPTNDLLGSQVLGTLSMGYDLLYDILSEDVKQHILEVVDKRLKIGLKNWPGKIECRHVENHFWQMELAGNFQAALATLHHLESAREMLNYTYGLFLARFPNLSTADGGWAEGEGYYSVNRSAIVDMALLLKRLGKIDIFQMGWYRNLMDYHTCYAPFAAPISGFGDMHDRVGSGSNVGKAEALVMACEENDKKALYRLFAMLRPLGNYFSGRADADYDYRQQLLNIMPWYQVVNDIRLTPDDVRMPKDVPADKVFLGVGTAAMHLNALQPWSNTSVYFRSSPFGAKGHMHANQNAFNISRKGERLFYSTGYYTSFSDPHSLTSYRHTRAHNTILVNGCGQAFGHEGYGWIKRHLSGKEISYVCGDATPAYRTTVDGQFLNMNKEYGISQTPEFGFADSHLKKFERHVAFVRPDVVVIYDILEAEEPSEWSFLLHTYQPSTLQADGAGLMLDTKRNHAVANVFGSVDLKSSLTDEFFSPAVDFKKKYGKRGTPKQYHATFTTAQKSAGMKFLAVICLSDRKAKPVVLRQLKPGVWKAGDITIEAEMTAGKPGKAVISYGENVLSINPDGKECTLLREKKGEQRATNLTPMGNH